MPASRQGRKSQKQRLAEAGHTTTKPTPITATSPPPPSIADDPVAAATWLRVRDTLAQQGYWQDTDGLAVERYCTLASVVAAATPGMLTGRWAERSKTGWSQPSAEWQAFEKASRQMLALEKSLHLSPETRRKADVANAEPADELLEFLRLTG